MSTSKPTPVERARIRRVERCEHFTGTMNATCKAGHAYAKFGKIIPCIATFDGSERPPCADRLLPTPEQIRERDEEMQRAIVRMGAARRAIVEHIKARGRWERDDSGSLPCPNCEGGTLHYRYAGSYNGHIHGQCTTPGCASWME